MSATSINNGDTPFKYNQSQRNLTAFFNSSLSWHCSVLEEQNTYSGDEGALFTSQVSYC